MGSGEGMLLSAPSVAHGGSYHVERRITSSALQIIITYTDIQKRSNEFTKYKPSLVAFAICHRLG